VRSHVDHLVVAAKTLEEGVAWCERTLGITPGPGGEHPLMGTHNRLFPIATVNFPRAYFEIIAINSIAATAQITRARRWFDLDSEVLQTQLREHGPQLIHFVANVPKVAESVAALGELGLDRGPAIAASRMTPNGQLNWKITVRDDGQRLMNGCLPTLIEWGDVHPAQTMLRSGVSLQSLKVTHPDSAQLQAAYAAIDLQSVAVRLGSANLLATLSTPLGLVTLESRGI
jgi:D-alanyl-D-alanine carboxypeptidase